MIDRLSKQVVNWLVRTEVVKNEDFDIYLFGLHQGIISIINYITTLVIALIFGRIIEGILFIVVYKPLRICAGGFHMRTEMGCYILSSIMTCAVLMASKIFRLNLLFLLVFIVSVFIIWFLSPVEDTNKPLDDIEYHVYKKRAKIVLSIECILVTISCVFHIYRVTKMMMITIITLGIVVLLGEIRNQCVKENFEGSIPEQKRRG